MIAQSQLVKVMTLMKTTAPCEINAINEKDGSIIISEINVINENDSSIVISEILMSLTKMKAQSK